MKSTCKMCDSKKSPFVMNNKLVCLDCDELLFDMEIECEEEHKSHTGLGLVHGTDTVTTVNLPISKK